MSIVKCFYTAKEIATLLGMTHECVLGYIRAGDLIALDMKKPGGRRSTYRVGADDLDDFKHRHSTSNRAENPSPKRRQRRSRKPASGATYV